MSLMVFLSGFLLMPVRLKYVQLYIVQLYVVCLSFRSHLKPVRQFLQRCAEKGIISLNREKSASFAYQRITDGIRKFALYSSMTFVK